MHMNILSIRSFVVALIQSEPSRGGAAAVCLGVMNAWVTYYVMSAWLLIHEQCAGDGIMRS